MIKVLFVCPDNSLLSPAAKAMLTHIGGNEFVVESAGISTQPMHTVLAQVLLKFGITINDAQQQTIEVFKEPETAKSFHYIIPLTQTVAEHDFSAFRYAAKNVKFQFDDFLNHTGNTAAESTVQEFCTALELCIEDFVVDVLDKRLK